MSAALIDALHHARHDDASTVLHKLDETAVATGIAQARLPICVAVSDFVLEHSKRAATAAPAIALTRRALSDETVTNPDIILRALIRLADPAIDEALVRTEAKRPRTWILSALLRNRRGADGRVIIAPGVNQFLRKQIARAERRLADRRTPVPARLETDLVTAAAQADDPDLAATALPLAIHLRQVAAVVRGLRTLRDHGVLDALWQDRLREDIGAAKAFGSPYSMPSWEAVLAFGDTGDDAHLDLKLRHPRDGLPELHHPDAWTAPNTGSQLYEIPWHHVLSYAKVVGDGDEGTQAGQCTARGLDEAAAREDIPTDIRRRFEIRYPRAVYWTARPTVETLTRAREAAPFLNPATRHFATRELLRRGLLHGSLTAPEAVAHAEPAAEVLALAFPTPPTLAEYYTSKGKNGFAPHFVTIPPEAEERYQAELRAAIAATIGPDPARWLKVLTRVAAWKGGLDALLKELDLDRAPLPTRRGPRWPRGVDPAAVLLAVAPAEVVAAVQEVATSPDAATFPNAPEPEPLSSESRALTGILARILDRGPVPRWLLNLAIGPHGTEAMRLAAARNPATTVGTLWHLADREPAEPSVLAAVYLHPLASLELRIAVIVRSEAAGGLHPRLIRRLTSRDADLALLEPALESHDPEVLHTVLRRGSRTLQTDRRIIAYANLAAAAGPEPVWALELERAGSLENMHEAVRASMTGHSDEPLRTAASDTARPAPGPVAADWDADFPPPSFDTAALAHAHLDGHAERWLRLAEPGASLTALLVELEAATSEAPADLRTSAADRTPEGAA